METLGSQLRKARELRGLSLAQLADLTKITIPTLRAIESNEIERLPGTFYTRGFLRAYAREVGLDPAETVRRYSAILDNHPAGTTESRRAKPTGGLQAVDQGGGEASDGRGPWALVSVAAAVGLGVAALVLLLKWPVNASRVSRSVDATPKAVARLDGEQMPPPVPEAPQAPPEPTAPSDAVAAASDAPDSLRLELQPSGLCWISATADGKQSVYRLMQASEHETVEAHDEVVLRVGDPANFVFEVNGAPGRSIGAAGVATTIRITRQNYHEWLAR